MDVKKDKIISEVRSFSRFYTNILGLLNQSILNTNYSLTEVRVLLEISITKDCTANVLIDKLDIDRGYLSRIINRFKCNELITKQASPKDGRLNFLKLTQKGKQVLSELEERSNNQVWKLVSSLTDEQKQKLVESMEYIKGSLSFPEETFKIRTYKPEDMDYIIKKHRELYEHEYGFSSIFGDYVEKYLYQFNKYYDKAKENIWIAEMNSSPVGVIAIAKVDNATAQLRWFLIEPKVRGKGLGHKLIKTAMDFCKEKKYNHVFLWTADVLKTARHIYSSYGFKLTESIDNTSWADKLVKEERWDLYLDHDKE
ncbi:bifunctional helix-turn-helix transcriptional regulator/GNAT family N-acetyltransferase [Clostridium hydrogenum]|uniref:bifunctional helix-turn-helix transcriptional regulator/GNAT family N-acetyltransferase n=1 Tax=Clostridium hydrogenum TaxID=2855764 RepID=UPI001F2FA1A3|nr:helix-turn-helix domain-containing GNAT family N-acetyltransferase [Clostridium hydrogenum]